VVLEIMKNNMRLPPGDVAAQSNLMDNVTLHCQSAPYVVFSAADKDASLSGCGEKSEIFLTAAAFWIGQMRKKKFKTERNK
jgi:hypothetical protein